MSLVERIKKIKLMKEFITFISEPKEALGVIIALIVGIPMVAIGYAFLALSLLAVLGVFAIVAYEFLDVLFRALGISWWIW